MSKLEQELQKWLIENKAYLTVAVKTPRGEHIKPENFVPSGWKIVIGVRSVEKESVTHASE